jgi:hypothetical protein
MGHHFRPDSSIPFWWKSHFVQLYEPKVFSVAGAILWISITLWPFTPQTHNLPSPSGGNIVGRKAIDHRYSYTVRGDSFPCPYKQTCIVFDRGALLGNYGVKKHANCKWLILFLKLTIVWRAEEYLGYELWLTKNTRVSKSTYCLGATLGFIVIS